MKKSMTCLLLAVFAAGVAVADGPPWWKFGFGNNAGNEDACPQEAPRRDGSRFEGRRPDMRDMNRPHRGPVLNEEQRTKIKAYYEEVHQLAEAARAEAEPVKKEELVGQLRAKLTEGAKRMQAEFSKRLEQAEKDVAKMRERLDEGEKNMSARVEEHLQKILSGDRPEHPRGDRSGPRAGRPRPHLAE
jgi:hypothetical protein